MLIGRVAADEFIAKPNTPTFAIFLMNLNGFRPVSRKIPIG